MEEVGGCRRKKEVEGEVKGVYLNGGKVVLGSVKRGSKVEGL